VSYTSFGVKKKEGERRTSKTGETGYAKKTVSIERGMALWRSQGLIYYGYEGGK